MATENPTWGYTRTQGALKNLGHRVAWSTVAKIPREHSIPPSRQRPITWHSFLRAHWRAFLAADFFTTEVWTAHGLVTYYFRAPNCNAHAKRFVRSIKEECLNRVIPLGEGHLRRTLADFIAHYHHERNHQGPGNELIDPPRRPHPGGPGPRRSAERSRPSRADAGPGRRGDGARHRAGQRAQQFKMLSVDVDCDKEVDFSTSTPSAGRTLEPRPRSLACTPARKDLDGWWQRRQRPAEGTLPAQ
jgi:hypothetical protein